MVFIGAGTTALSGVAIAAPGQLPKWLSLSALFLGAGALAITRLDLPTFLVGKPKPPSIVPSGPDKS